MYSAYEGNLLVLRVSWKREWMDYSLYGTCFGTLICGVYGKDTYRESGK